MLRIGIDKGKHPDFRNAGDGSIQCTDNFGYPVNIRLGIGQDDCVATIIRRDGGIVWQQVADVFDQLPGIAESNRDDLGDHHVLLRDFQRVGSRLHRKVFNQGLVLFDNLQDASTANGGVPLFIQDCVQKIDCFLPIQRLLGENSDVAAHFSVPEDDEPSGFTHVLQY